MVSHAVDPERSLLMGRVRRSGTAPELTLRAALHQAGYRYRLNSGTGLPGTPDIVLRRFRLAIFVDGCFWHGCERHGTMPKTNPDFWSAKILRNKQRDRQVDKSLNDLGWRVLRVWEHEVRSDIGRILRRLKRRIGV
jgi:DNA mismatch endonuclease, patch repair protein